MGDLLLLHLFIQSFISTKYGLMNIYFILGVIIQCYIIYFVTQIVSALAIGSSFQVSSVFL